jgi:hypothetical protein
VTAKFQRASACVRIAAAIRSSSATSTSINASGTTPPL